MHLKSCSKHGGAPAKKLMESKTQIVAIYIKKLGLNKTET